MNNLQALSPQSGTKTLEDSLRKSIALAFERTLTDIYPIDNMVKDILSEFPKLKDEDFTHALRNGGLGKYGRCYKLSTTEICYWIREYVKEKTKKNILL
jgi:hypothetical protein